MKDRRNKPRFLDYRRSHLPFDVALKFALPAEYGSTAREVILSKKAYVNDALVTSCDRLVSRYEDKITVNGIELKRPIPMPKYYLCYKPRGVICSNKRNEGVDRNDALFISDWLIDVFESSASASHDTNANIINTVGRLDEESEGLLLLSNDGSFSRLLCDPEFGLEKTYRVIAKGSGYNSLKSNCVSENDFSSRIAQMIERGNLIQENDNLSKTQKRYELCKVLDVGKLTSQHASDDSYYVLLDLRLREGKTHAVRRIIKNSGLRVFYLSRIEVEGLDDLMIVKPGTLIEAGDNGFVPAPNQKISAKKGKLITERSSRQMMLSPGEVVELSCCQVDKIFSLRTC